MKLSACYFVALVVSMCCYVTSLMAQTTCGFDEMYRNALKDEATRTQVNNVDRLIKAKVSSFRTNKRAAYALENILPGANTVVTASGIAYEIPVVVHVVHGGTAIGSTDNPTDQKVINIIEFLNKVFGATGTGSFASIAEGGVDIPIRFVLAKRDPDCNATTGINRVDGSVLGGYADYGIKYNGANGAADGDVKILSRWPVGSYYNIWLVNKINSTSNVIGYANYPGSVSPNEGTVMMSHYATSNTSYLAHELAHAMGVIHTFGTGNGSACETPETDCANEGDKVCDTEQSKAWPACSNPGINPCTGAAYNGVQYNIMNYGGCLNRFTPGQRDRAMAGLLTSRTSLLYSQAGKAPDMSTANLKPMQRPPAILYPNNFYNSGPANVVMNGLNYKSSGYGVDGNKDYIANLCLFKGMIPDTGTTIAITTIANRQYIKAWIDFNNSGSFEANELILDERAPQMPAYPYEYIHTATVTPAMIAQSVKNIPVRMRIMADRVPVDAPMAQLSYGQTEDFVVTIAGNVALATNILRLDAAIANKELQINWRSTGEESGSRYEIELSKDGKNFVKVKTVAGKIGTELNAAPVDYNVSVHIQENGAFLGVSIIAGLLLLGFPRKRNSILSMMIIFSVAVMLLFSCHKNSDITNQDGTGKLYIRIAQVHKDGTAAYSKIIVVKQDN